MRIFRRVPTLGFDLVSHHGALVSIEIPTAFEMTYVVDIMLAAGLGCPMEVVAGAESGVLGTAVVVVDAVELSSVGRSVVGRFVRVTLCSCLVKRLPVFAFKFERFVLLPAIAHGGARWESRTFVFKKAWGSVRLAYDTKPA